MGFGLKLRELGLGKHKKCVLGLGGKLRDEHSANRIVVRKDSEDIKIRAC